LLETWSFVLESIEQNPQALIGGVRLDHQKWLLETFMASEKVGWDDPWLQSLDLEYHKHDPTRGLFFSVTPGQTRRRMEQQLFTRDRDRAFRPRTRAPQGRPAPSPISRSPINLTSSTGTRSRTTAGDFLSWAIPSKPTTPKSTNSSRSAPGHESRTSTNDA